MSDLSPLAIGPIYCRVMNERANMFRSVALPIAVMGLAMTAPVSPASAQLEQLVDHTVRRAEMLTTQLTETARELCRPDGNPATFAVAADLARPLIAELPTPRCIAAPASVVSASALDPCLPQLIDLPPPTDC